MLQNIFSTYMGFGKSLREYRKAAQLTQQQLADQVTTNGFRITGSYISMIEREYDKTRTGEPTRVNADFVRVVAPLLGWDVDTALIEAGYAPATSGPLFAIAPDLSIKLGAEVSPEERQEIAEELALAYEVIMARRKRRESQND